MICRQFTSHLSIHHTLSELYPFTNSHFYENGIAFTSSQNGLSTTFDILKQGHHRIVQYTAFRMVSTCSSYKVYF